MYDWDDSGYLEISHGTEKFFFQILFVCLILCNQHQNNAKFKQYTIVVYFIIKIVAVYGKWIKQTK